ncbi:hypothetical protein, partial [Kaarinaea lacus]
MRKKEALCTGNIYKETEIEHNQFKYSYVIKYRPLSPFNYYLIRDNVDIPEIILTAAEMGFLKAEAYFRGLGVPS